MTLTKSFLLGSAAAVLAAAGAQAADLPSKKAAPAQYVKICDAAGTGYFYIPGTDTCLKVGGYAELDWVYRGVKDTWNPDGSGKSLVDDRYTNANQRGNNAPTIDAEIQLDSITKTSWGDLHTAIGIEAQPGDGGTDSQTSNGAYLDYAYFEWAGLTAGKHESFFHNIGNMYGAYQTPDYKRNLLAYTASFGGGFSATLSLEDPVGSSVNGYNPGWTSSHITTGGNRTPDIVGALRVKQGWGEASLIGGYHETNFWETYNDQHHNVAGYAVGGYLSFNLPMLAAGDTVSFQGIWERDALGFAGLGGHAFNGYQNKTPDVLFIGWDGGVMHQNGYSLLADLLHNWTPTVSTEVMASYGNVKYSGALDPYWSQTNSYNEWRVGQVTKWKPVKGLEFGLETQYVRYHNVWNSTQASYLAGAATGFGPTESDLRVQFRAIRSF